MTHVAAAERSGWLVGDAWSGSQHRKTQSFMQPADFFIPLPGNTPNQWPLYHGHTKCTRRHFWCKSAIMESARTLPLCGVGWFRTRCNELNEFTESLCSLYFGASYVCIYHKIIVDMVAEGLPRVQKIWYLQEVIDYVDGYLHPKNLSALFFSIVLHRFFYGLSKLTFIHHQLLVDTLRPLVLFY